MLFIEHLMRGGSFGHYWLKQSKTTIWWPTDSPPAEVPRDLGDVYFGVHPSATSKSNTKRTSIEDVEVVNCLYADIDSKNFGDNKAEAGEHIKRLNPRPSVIVDSGGGYHCYWLLQKPFMLDTSFKLEIAKSLQEQWVRYVEGDPAVHDLARILRLPGTINYKYDPPRPVRIVHANFQRLYTLEELESFLPDLEHRGDDVGLGAKFPEPRQPNDLSDQELIDRALSAVDGQKFRVLWLVEEEGYDSTSEADLGFCAILAFWTGGDGERIDRLFRASGRMRPKWEREDYRVGTILKALAKTTTYYRPHDGLLTASGDDEGNAQCFMRLYPNKYLKVLDWGWCCYTGTHWEVRRAEASLNRDISTTLKGRRQAVWNEVGPKGFKVRDPLRGLFAATKSTAALINSCRSILGNNLDADIQNFDLPLDELNCLNGVLNLRTGELTPHDPSQRFSYCLKVEYKPEANQDLWVKWLFEVTSENKELVDYLQEAIGYSLTGHTREEVAFYLYGRTRCGKGTFDETLIELLGERTLAKEVAMEKFMAKKYDSGSDDFFLASLHGSRFIVASETVSRKFFDAAKLKRWSGGNIIHCAHKHKDHFDYRPQFKLWFSSNNPPRIDADDEAGWGRIRVIHFPNCYVKTIDKTLKERMKTREVLEGVLAWAVEGSMKWYRRDEKGLVAPSTVLKETEAARDAVNDVLHWATARLIHTGASCDRVVYSVAYDDYRLWCSEEGLKNPRPKKYWKESLLVNQVVTDVKVAIPRTGAKAAQCLIGVQSNFFLNIGSSVV